MTKPKKILITGVAGFIGFHLAKYLIKKKYQVIGLDNMNNYYDVSLKKNRINILKDLSKKNFLFFKLNICKYNNFSILHKFKIDYIFHLAAQAGVRYSLEQPQKFIDSNITGFLNIINFAKAQKINKIFYASSSSVYGSNKKASVKDLKKVILPEDKEKLIQLIKDKGLWEEFAMLNYSRFNSRVRKGELDEDIMDGIEMGEDWRVSLSRRKEGEG